MSDEFFVEELQEQSVNRMNVTQTERFMRDELADIVVDRYTLQLRVVRRLELVLGVALVVVAMGVSGMVAL